MSTSANAAAAAPSARIVAQPAPPASAADRAALVALVLIVTLVLTGHMVGQAIVTALVPAATGETAVLNLAMPGIVGLYQIAFLLILVRVLAPLAGNDLSLVRPGLGWWQWCALLAGLFVLKFATAVLTSWGALKLGLDPTPLTALTMIAKLMKGAGWPLLLAGGMIAAIAEELLFRGYLSRRLEASRLGFWAGAILTSLLWAGLHFTYPLSTQGILLVTGIALSVVRARTGSLYPGMLWHVLNNVLGLFAIAAIVR